MTSPGFPILYLNAVHVPEDDLFLVSTPQAETATHTFHDGLILTVSGGLEFANRWGGEGTHEGDHIKLEAAGRYVEWILASGDAFEPTVVDKLLIRTRTYGVWRPIKEQTPLWLENELSSPSGLTPLQLLVIKHWITHRQSATTQPAPAAPVTVP